ncbi:MAG: amino acid adenylation domain-containing protein [Phycisphaerae bacterium]|nr:amino acid adenylation domain-containing protein [Gemmatimonadaceae bacterium]
MTESHVSSADDDMDDFDALAALLAAEGIESTSDVIKPRDRSRPAPMSFAQELLWLIHRGDPAGTSYNVARSRRLVGDVDTAALRRAFDALLERHEVLRTTYAVSDQQQPVQIVRAPQAVEWREHDVRHLPQEAREGEVARLAREATDRPFDLTVDVPLRVELFRTGDADYVLVFESHHICFDGWSRDVMFRELRVLYEAFSNGVTPDLAPLPLQFGDYAAWQREELQGERLEHVLAYWRAELDSASFVLELPTDFPRPSKSGSEGVTRTMQFDAPFVTALKQLGQSADATLYMVLLAAYQTVLHRVSGQPDILVGSPVAGRSQSQTEALIGYFANTIVQRGRFAGNPTFRELLTQVRTSALGAFDNQDAPFEKIVLELQGAQQVSRSPVFQVVFTQLNGASETFSSLGSVQVRPFGLESNETKFDLTLFMSEREGGLELALRARAELFRPRSVERMLDRMKLVLEAAVANADIRVSDIPLLTETERQKLTGWNSTSRNEGAPATLTALFEAQVLRVPERTAVRANAELLTYAALNARANQLAHMLRARGVTDNQPVGLALDRSADAVVALLGILKAGGCYVPIPPELPAARQAQQVRESGARVVVTNTALAAALPANTATVLLDAGATELSAFPTDNLPGAATPQSLAYVLYTSGSTGTPKGVAVTHANAVHYARAVSRVLADVPATTDGDGFAALDGWHFGLASTLGADLGNTSLLPSLLAGGTLHVLDTAVTTEPARYAEYVRGNPLDLLKITPNHVQALLGGKHGAELAPLLPARWIVTGGEALRPAVARMLLSAGTCRVLNHYGPTETTVGVCTFEVTTDSLTAVTTEGAQTMPVGRPLANTHAYVVDNFLNELPPGIPGELLIGGAGVAEGYLNRPELTAERFIQFADERVYRTGDRVRRLSDGAIEFLSRTDDQVKVRGYRVELGEIEEALRLHAGVQSAAVVLHADDAGDAQIVAYAVPRTGSYAVSHTDRPTPHSLHEWLGVSLPKYMLPSAIIMLDARPLTPNGKLDKRALPEPDGGASQTDRYVAPRSETEQELVAIWVEVLKKERIGVQDDFLELGGHSLIAIRVLGKISKQFGIRLALRSLFDAPTVAQLAELVDAARKTAAPAAPAIGVASRNAYRLGKSISVGTPDEQNGGKT